MLHQEYMDYKQAANEWRMECDYECYGKSLAKCKQIEDLNLNIYMTLKNNFKEK